MKNNLIVVIIIVAVAIGAFIFVSDNKAMLSGVDGQAYNSTSTRAMGTPAAREFRRIKSYAGEVGTVTVASSTAFYLTLWNATSTTDTGSSTIAVIATSTTGSLIFESAFGRGLIVERPAGFVGDYVITWR